MSKRTLIDTNAKVKASFLSFAGTIWSSMQEKLSEDNAASSNSSGGSTSPFQQWEDLSPFDKMILDSAIMAMHGRDIRNAFSADQEGEVPLHTHGARLAAESPQAIDFVQKRLEGSKVFTGYFLWATNGAFSCFRRLSVPRSLSY